MYPLLKLAVPPPKLMAFERYLFIGPHPDDIEVACAPTVKRLTEAGKQVSFLIVTDGRMGSIDPALSGDTLVARRQAEARESAALLGVNELCFLPFHDGGLYPVEQAAIALAKEIARLRPDVIFAPDPDVRSECHPDHIKTGQAAKSAICMCPFMSIMESVGGDACHAISALALYYTDRPNVRLRVARQFPSRLKALACHKSQFTEKDLKTLKLYFTLRSLRIGTLRGKCDGYRAYSPVHTHCFPEAARW